MPYNKQNGYHMEDPKYKFRERLITEYGKFFCSIRHRM